MRMDALLALLLICPNCPAADFQTVKLDELYIDYKNFAILNPNNRIPLLYPDAAKEGLNLGANIDLFKVFALDAEVQSLTDQSQYRAVGLKLDLGIRLTDGLYVGYHHLSQHILDKPGNFVQPFPVEDALEIKWTIYNARPGRPALF